MSNLDNLCEPMQIQESIDNGDELSSDKVGFNWR